MTLRTYIHLIGLSIISLFLLGTQVSANSYTSEVFSSINQCNQQKDKNNTLYPNFSRSDCVESSDGKFYYNICDTNYCIANQDRSQLVENNEKEEHQYGNINTTTSRNYTLDYATNVKIQEIAEGLEKKFQKMSEKDLEKWNKNFLNVLNQLTKKSSNNNKNLALIEGIKQEVTNIIEKQKREHDLCKNQFGEGWKEASFFFESNNMVSWIEGNKKYSLSCEYLEPKVENKPGQIDKYVAPPLTDENEVENMPEKIDPIQSLEAQKGETCSQWMNRIGKNSDNLSAKLEYNNNSTQDKNIQNRCAYMMWKDNQYSCTSASINYVDRFSPNNPSYPVQECENSNYTASTLIDGKKLTLDDESDIVRSMNIELKIDGLYQVSRAGFYDKLSLSWNTGNNHNCKFVNNSGENYDFGKKYNLNGEITENGMINSQNGSFDFLIAKVGPVQIQCSNNEKSVDITWAGHPNDTFESKQGKLIKVNSSIENGDILNLQWNIHPNIAGETCTAFGFNTPKLGTKGRVKLHLTGLRSTTYYGIECSDPRSIQGGKISSKIHYNIPKNYQSIKANKTSIKKGDKVTLSWDYEGGNNAMIIDVNEYNSISGKHYLYLRDRDNNFTYQGGKLNSGNTGKVNVTPFFSTTYMLIRTDKGDNISASFIDITVDGKEIKKDQGKIEEMKSKYLNEYKVSNNTLYRDVQVQGQCNGSFTNNSSSRTFNKSLFGCSSGDFSGFTITEASNGSRYTWQCKGKNLGETRTCSGILGD